jgi:hypothetical protein
MFTTSTLCSLGEYCERQYPELTQQPRPHHPLGCLYCRWRAAENVMRFESAHGDFAAYISFRYLLQSLYPSRMCRTVCRPYSRLRSYLSVMYFSVWGRHTNLGHPCHDARTKSNELRHTLCLVGTIANSTEVKHLVPRSLAWGECWANSALNINNQ